MGGTGEWELNLKDGTRMTFPDAEFAIAATQGAVTSITDRFGNQVVLTRDASNLNRLTRMGSANGSHSIEFTYGPNNKITQARDNTGRTVNYEYDAGERLWKVTDVAGGVTEYSYDTSGRMLTIKDPRGIVYLTNEYDINGRVLRQTQADGSTYQFAYTLNAGKITQTDVTNPSGFVRRVTFNNKGYWMTDRRAVGRPEEQLSTLERDSTTSFITAHIDHLGRRTTYGFDAFGNLTGLTKLAGTPAAVSSTWT